ncbi:MAG TPA: hypothetical protein VGK74_22385 [Symbiobacteriaceae bacterium]|jgi:hypothetical protein
MADKSYPIGLRNHLLTQEHYENMGAAIWVYMWLCDRVTEEYQAPDGENRGRVLGGTVITAEQIGVTFGVHAQTVRNHLKLLHVGRYVIARQCKGGFQIEVRDSQKWQRERSPVPNTSPSSVSQTLTPTELNGSKVENPCNPQTLQLLNPSTFQLCDLREPSIKTMQIETDITEDIPSIPPEEETPADVREAWDRTVRHLVSEGGLTTKAADLLKEARPVGVQGDLLTVEIPPGKDVLERLFRWERVILQAFESALGRKLRVGWQRADYEARAGPGP